METKFCHTTNIREATSPITGRKLRINLDPNRIFVPEDVDVAEIPVAVVEMRELWLDTHMWTQNPELIKSAILQFESIETDADFIRRLDELFIAGFHLNQPKGARYQLKFWLTKLWSHGLIALPLLLGKTLRMPVNQQTVGSKLLKDFEAVLAACQFRCTAHQSCILCSLTFRP